MHKPARLLLLAAALILAAADPPPKDPGPAPTAPPPAAPPPAAPPAPAAKADTKPADKPPPPARTEQVSPDHASGIIDTAVHGSDGQDIGHIIDVLVDDSGRPKAAMIDFGGFLGVGSRKVAVAWSDLRFKPAAPEGMVVTLDLSADQIREALLGKDTKPAATVVVKKDPAAPPDPPKPAPSGTAPPPKTDALPSTK